MNKEQQVRDIPRIQQQPRMASNTAIHYGYTAYKDINLAGPYGIEHHVQPQGSPYYSVIPCRQLLPFTNVTHGVIDDLAAATTSFVRNAVPVVQQQKTARECVEEMEAAYEQWGFVGLHPLTGFSEEEAFHVFQTIQPFAYRLKDLRDEVEFGADERINETQPYMVKYDMESFTLAPLSAELKEVAHEVKALMLRSIDVAMALGEDLRDKTTQAMTQYFATGTGKRRPDPHDVYVFSEFEQELPKLVENKKTDDAGGLGVLSQLAEVLGVKKKTEEIEAELAELRALKDELKAATATEKVVTMNAEVTVDGKTAKVVGKPFGKVKVEFEDGSTATVTKDEIE